MWRSEEISPSTICFCCSIRVTSRPSPARDPIADATMILNFDVALRLQCGRQPRRGTRVAAPSMALRVDRQRLFPMWTRDSTGVAPAAGPAAALLPESVEKTLVATSNAKACAGVFTGCEGANGAPHRCGHTRGDGRATNGGAVSRKFRAHTQLPAVVGVPSLEREVRRSQLGRAAPVALWGRSQTDEVDNIMGRSILLWLLGVPIPIIILLALFWR
jgi:hypothetical protein